MVAPVQNGPMETPSISVRRAQPGDLEAMRRAKHAAGLAAWQHILPRPTLERLGMPPRWEDTVRDPAPRSAALVVELEGSVVGFAIVRPSDDDDALPSTGELDGFFTLPDAWGRGAGRSLLSAAVEVLRDAGFRQATLWTAADNTRPRRVYDAAGWMIDGAERQRTFDGVNLTEVRYRIRL